MPEPISVADWFVIGENDSYLFAIASSGDRWLGCALPLRSRAERAFQDQGLEVSPQMVLVLPEVSDGCELGVLNKNRAILLTGAVAEDVEKSYGGIDRWFVPEELRGKPDDFRCDNCGSVGCDGSDCVRDPWEDD